LILNSSINLPYGQVNRTPSGDGTDDQENISCDPIPLFDKSLPPFDFIRELDEFEDIIETP
jgi:hypothetical protein